MKLIAVLACLLLAQAQVSQARQLPTSVFDLSVRTESAECAAELFDAVQATALYYVEQFGFQLAGLRESYRQCNELPVGGEREECLLEFGRYVIATVRNLQPEFEAQKENVLRYALMRLDEYFMCRQARQARDGTTNTFCAIKVYEATRSALAPYYQLLLPRLTALKDAFELCYNGAEAGKATCYYELFEVARVEALEIVDRVKAARPQLVSKATELLDGYYLCRLD